jgi:oligopeptide transport system ATP-binding protein
MALLTVKNLNVSFPMQKRELHAVRGIDFTLSEEEVIGIVGESGCGKSASAKAVVQLFSSKNVKIEGEVIYKGKNLSDLSSKQMQKVRGKEIGMIFQDPMTSLNPTMKVGEQIIESLRVHFPHLSRAEMRLKGIEMLEKVGIPSPQDRFDSYPHTLSGGLRQRCLIAAALICHPTLLIADEVTTALDVTIQAQILDLLKEIKKEMKMSILLITHDLSIVAQFCDRVLVMYAGKIVEDASVDALFSKPEHPYTQRLLQALPRLDQEKTEKLHAIEGSPPNLSASIKGCSFTPRCTQAMRICAQESPPPYSIGPAHFACCFLHDPRKKQ